MKEQTQKLLRYVGLCKRAGGVVRGADVIEKNLRKTAVVILASDASGRTAGQIRRKCSSAAVPCVTVDADKYDLAHAVGASSPCAAAAILAGKGPAEMVKSLAMETDSADKHEQ